MARSAVRSRINSRRQGEAAFDQSSIGGLGDDSRRGTTVVGNYLEDREAREQLTAILCQFPPRVLSKASGRSIDVAKLWVSGDRTPNTASTANMARSLPALQRWLAERSGYSRAARAGSADEVVIWASANRNSPGQDGAIARAILREAGAAS